MANMNSSTRQRIIDICTKQGFTVQLKADGSDNYDKNLMFSWGKNKSNVFIDRVIGISKSSGDLSYLKVAVHPDYFMEEVINPAAGVENYPNLRTGINLHASSNYIGFRRCEGSNEPSGKCYKVNGLIALEKLLAGLQSF